MLIWAAWGKSFRWGLYAFVKDESDIVLDRQTGRMVAAVIRYCLHDRSDPVQRAGLIGAVGLWSMSDMADFWPINKTAALASIAVRIGFCFPNRPCPPSPSEIQRCAPLDQSTRSWACS